MGMWFEEMINNRNKSTVRGMKWTPDGQRICIIYEDGAVIVGSVDGNRLWGKELKTQLAHVQWSPDGRSIIFCTLQCEVHIYDAIGNFISKMNLYCPTTRQPRPRSSASTGTTGRRASRTPRSVRWPSVWRTDGYSCSATRPTRARSSSTRAWWPPDQVVTNGSVLAVSGNQASNGAADRRDVSMVQFYSATGQLRAPSRCPARASRRSREGGSLRVALAVDSYIYFANIRPDYRWGFGDTLVCAHTQPSAPTRR